MSNDMRATPWILRASVAIYCQLLTLYPQAFRRDYGEHMTQVFRDCCREALHTNGIAGLWRYWTIALADLLVSAFAERRYQEFSMSRTTWIRLGSLAAIIGGCVAAFSYILETAIAASQLLDQDSALELALFQIQILGSKVTPGLWFFIVLALIGLQARGAGRIGAAGWVTISIAILGEIIFGLGAGIQAYVMIPQSDGCISQSSCNFYDPNHYLATGLMLILLGWSIFVVGMLFYGVTALRRSLLPRRNWLPLGIGVTNLLIVAGAVGIQFVSTGFDYAVSQKIDIVLNSIALIPSIIWILLGTAMWPRADEAETAHATIYGRKHAKTGKLATLTPIQWLRRRR